MSILEKYHWPSREGLTPFVHQKTTSGFVLTNKRSLVLNEMGTGKTLSILWAIDILFWQKKIRKVCVICPLSTMKTVWQREAFFNMPHLTTVVAHGSKPQRVAAIRGPAQVVIINHDGIKTCLDELVEQEFDVVVIDELTAYKSNSDRTNMAIYLCNRKGAKDPFSKYAVPKAVWGMTGEMTPNSPLESYTQCKVVDNENPRIPRYFGQFRDMCMFQPSPLDHPDFWLPKEGAAHVVAAMAQPAIRFARRDCIDLPETTIIDVEVDLSPEQKTAYKAMKEHLIVETAAGKVTAANAAVKLNKLLQISAGAVITSDEGDGVKSVQEIPCGPSLSELFRIYDETPQKKLVVFAAYRATIHMLKAKFAEREVNVEVIYGDVNQNERAKHIERFQTGDLNVLILQPQSSAHGITLVAASTIVWYSLVPSNELYQQGNARIVRPGQNEKTFIYNLIRTPAEQHLANILKRKGNMSDEVKQLFADRLF